MRFHVQPSHLFALACTAESLHQEVLVHHISSEQGTPALSSVVSRGFCLSQGCKERERTADDVASLQMLTALGCAAPSDPTRVHPGLSHVGPNTTEASHRLSTLLIAPTVKRR